MEDDSCPGWSKGSSELVSSSVKSPDKSTSTSWSHNGGELGGNKLWLNGPAIGVEHPDGTGVVARKVALLELEIDLTWWNLLLESKLLELDANSSLDLLEILSQINIHSDSVEFPLLNLFEQCPLLECTGLKPICTWLKAYVSQIHVGFYDHEGRYKLHISHSKQTSPSKSLGLTIHQD